MPREPAIEPDGDGALGDRLAEQLPDLEQYVRRHLGRQLRVRESVSDVVQSVCRHVLAEPDNFDYRGETAFRNYLRSCARNKIYRKWEFHAAEKRDHRREVRADAHTDVLDLTELARTSRTPSKALMQADRAAEILAAIENLPPLYRDAVRMHRLEGLSGAEIAARTGRTPGAVRNHVYRGLALLARALQD